VSREFDLKEAMQLQTSLDLMASRTNSSFVVAQLLVFFDEIRRHKKLEKTLDCEEDNSHIYRME
jgi:hypothetical protein